MERFARKTGMVGWGVTAVFFSTALGCYAWVGSFMRYMGDDYCYGMILSQKGFWGAQWYSYVYRTPYTGDRFALTFFSDLLHLSGPQLSSWLASLTLVLWVAGLVLAFRQVNRLLHMPSKPLAWLVGAAAFAFFVLYQAPDLSESFYWRSGMLPYFMPIIGGTWLAVWLLALVQKQHPFWFEWLGVGLLALINSGFSETAVALQAGGLALSLAFVLTFGWLRKRSTRAWKPLVCAMAGTFIGMIVMLVSPSNSWRLNSLPESLGLIPSVGFSLKYALDFSMETLRGLPVPTLIGSVISGSLGFELASGQPQARRLNLQHWLMASALVLSIGYALIVCTMAPSVFIQTWYPEPRALIVSRFAMEMTIFILGGLAGWFVRGLFSGGGILHLARVTAILLVLACGLYAIRGAARPLNDLPSYRQYAAQWDQRDAQIRQDHVNGVHDVTVIPLTHLLLKGGEISEDPGHWYNVCIAGYYGIDTIRSQPQE